MRRVDAVPHQLVFDEEVARLIGETRARCRACGYTLGDLEQPRCPECGHAVTLRDVGEYGTTEETRTALRLHGPIPCGSCGEAIVEPAGAACPACHTRIKLSWIPAYAGGPRALRGPRRLATVVGAFGVVAQVIPAAVFFARGLEGLLFVPAVVAGVWIWAVWRSRHHRHPPPAWALAAGPWAAVVPVLAWMAW